MDGLLCTLSDRIGADVIAGSGPKLRVISTLSVGYDHIHLPSCANRGIAVGNTPDVLSVATAELALSLMLAAGRRLKETQDVGTRRRFLLCVSS